MYFGESNRVGAILLRYGKIEESTLSWALDECERTGRPILEVLRKAGLINVFDAVFALMEQTTANLSTQSAVAEAFHRLPTHV